MKNTNLQKNAPPSLYPPVPFTPTFLRLVFQPSPWLQSSTVTSLHPSPLSAPFPLQFHFLFGVPYYSPCLRCVVHPALCCCFWLWCVAGVVCHLRGAFLPCLAYVVFSPRVVVRNLFWKSVVILLLVVLCVSSARGGVFCFPSSSSGSGLL